MSFETPEQKILLRKLEKVTSDCAASGIKYGKALASFNQAYGTNEIPAQKPAAEQMDQIKTQSIISAKRAKAHVLCQMTGEQLRLARKLPADMVKMVADDQLVGDVFTLEQLEAVL